jgi:hypothetical protein
MKSPTNKNALLLKRGVALSSGVVIALLVSGSCANSPMAISAMDATEIQAVPEDKLCFAHAQYLREQKPVIAAEVKRRGLTCKDEIAQEVSDCSMLSLTGSEPAPDRPGSTIYTVANSSSSPRMFRICAGMFQSSQFKIGASQSGRYGVMVDPNLAKVGAVIPNTTCPQPMLNECRPPLSWE